MSEFRVVAKTNEVAPNSVKAVDLEGNEIAIANVDGTYLAFGAQCGCISAFVGHHDEEVGAGDSLKVKPEIGEARVAVVISATVHGERYAGSARDLCEDPVRRCERVCVDRERVQYGVTAR